MKTVQNDSKISKFWNIASFDGINAELTMYGEICDKHPTDWWTGEELPGQYITPEGFLEDLETLKKAQNITIKLNSCGGDLYTGLAICNALKNLNKKITVDVEGVAASAGSIIMCAGDNVRVHAGSIVMIHGVSAELRGYWGLDDLKKQVRSFDTSENAIAEIYAGKTGMSIDKLRSMMTKETWMTGREAVEKGFADELVDSEPAQINMVNKSVLISNGIKLNFEGHDIPNDLINKGFTNNIGGKTMNQEQEVKNFLDKIASGLQATFSNFTNKSEKVAEPENKTELQPQQNEIEKIVQEAVLAERNRCKAIDELPGNVDATLKFNAKYGEKPCNAGELAVQVLSTNDPQNNDALKKLKNDAATSNSGDVEGTDAPPDAGDEEQKKINQAKQFAKDRQARKNRK